MKAQLDQHVPLPNLCRRRVWLVLKPILLLTALTVAVSTVHWARVPRWMTETGNESTPSIWDKVADYFRFDHGDSPTFTSTVDRHDRDLSALSVEDQVAAYMHDAHPMLYPFEMDLLANKIAAIGDAPITSLVAVLNQESFNGVKITGTRRLLATRALSRIGAPAVPQLMPLLRSENDMANRWAAGIALRDMDGDLGVLASEMEVNWEDIGSQSSSLQFMLLPKCNPPPEVVEKYVALLLRSEVRVRQAAAIALPLFGEELIPHVEAIQRHLHNRDLGSLPAIALWASGHEASRNVVRQDLTTAFANQSDYEHVIQVLSSPHCDELAREFSARLRVVFGEALNDVDKIAVGKLLVDADPSWAPPNTALFQLMERVAHHSREGLFYILNKKGVTIEEFLNDRRHPSRTDIARTRELLANVESSDPDVRAAAVVAMSMVDAYTHPLFIPLLTEVRSSPTHRNWRLAESGAGYWLPAWLRLRSYKAWLNSSPATFYNNATNMRVLKQMRQQILNECPELLSDYELLVRFVEQQEPE